MPSLIRSLSLFFALLVVAAAAIGAEREANPRDIPARWKEFVPATRQIKANCRESSKVQKIFRIETITEENEQMAVSACESIFYCIRSQTLMLIAEEKKTSKVVDGKAGEAAGASPLAYFQNIAAKFGLAHRGAKREIDFAERAKKHCGRAEANLRQMKNAYVGDAKHIQWLINNARDSKQRAEVLSSKGPRN